MKTQLRAVDLYYDNDDFNSDLEITDRLEIDFDFQKKEAYLEWRRKDGEVMHYSDGEFCFRDYIIHLLLRTQDGLVWNLSPIVVYYENGWIIDFNGRKQKFDSVDEAMEAVILAGREVL